ncbi:hypothetical protein ACF8FL_20050 [Vibrio sp. zbq_19]|uniref:hypothetical protein n=1 Tax=Vibrio TaxID=662 RepID=UPI0011204542|nr:MULTISPECIES: hypothetical protein [Vibrio]MCQ9102369.1 hypothetical protein [Vibrio alginolyticus]MDF5635915.1 hypothetical protein [Vibrio parahaemolyticus]MDW1833006.1 hypothetical protein [Vibrio sp. Vb1755]TOB38093.1 hypothetical protein CGK06_24040 [Vibrio parahaemolyticus]
MKIDSTNIKYTDLSDCLHMKIKIIGKSNRKGSDKSVGGQENCSGFNINKHVFDGMSVNEYQMMIANRFLKEDPQFSLTKHLKYDIERGFYELRD